MRMLSSQVTIVSGTLRVFNTDSGYAEDLTENRSGAP